MPFPYDKYPWLNFQELNLAYFIKHFREIFQQWDTMLNEMYDWKDATDAELAEWKSTVETGISSWETGLQQSMEAWKNETEADISAWEAATLTALNAWKTATTAVFEQIRTEAAASAQAAAGSASSAQTALVGAQAAQAAAEAAAAGIQSELTQIQTNTADISDLNTQINGGTTLNYIADKNIDSATGAIVDAANVSVSEKIPYTWTGATKYYCGDNTQTIYGVAFYDSSDALVRYFRNPYSTGGDSFREINAESQGASGAAYVRFSFLKGYTAYVTNVNGSITRYTAGEVTVDGLENRVADLESDIGEITSDIAALETADSDLSADLQSLASITTATVTKTEEIENDVWTEGYITLGGTVNSSSMYVYSEEIAVNKDDIIRTSSRARFITAYYNGSAVEAKGAEETDEYTVPEGVDTIIITLRAAYTKIITKTYTATENSLTSRVEALERTVNKASNTITAKAQSVTNDTVTALESVDTRKNMDIDFRGDISSFTSVTVGHGYMINYGAWIVVDSTNVTIYADENGDQKAQYPHGLTITHYIHVLIQQGDDTSASIIVESDSGRFKQDNVVFDSRRGDFFATINGTLTDVILTAVLKDLHEEIWMFGDSYQSLGSANRYPYYMDADGYLNNCLMSGFPGANATHQIVSFRNLVKISTPKYIVWCMGMNGSDTSSGINADWQACTDEVIATCDVKDITVILATIPNVPDRIQTFKNAYVKASGERYIDFAKAVGAEAAGATWYSGMLSSDDLHPSATGAIALYSELLADFPEIMG